MTNNPVGFLRWGSWKQLTIVDQDIESIVLVMKPFGYVASVFKET